MSGLGQKSKFNDNKKISENDLMNKDWNITKYLKNGLKKF